MKKPLRFKYYEPGDTLHPIIDEKTGVTEPCRFEWNPEVVCGAMNRKIGRWQFEKHPIPWTYNIRQIVVQSRKAYEILDGEDIPEGAYPNVIIRPPKPNAFAKSYRYPAKRPIICCVVCRWEDDLYIADGILNSKIPAIVYNHAPISDIFLQSRIAVFPFASSDELSCLSDAIARGCHIVASDAGAHEEYLSNHAEPGRWIVCHEWKQTDYLKAINILLGNPVEAFGTGRKDESIFGGGK